MVRAGVGAVLLVLRGRAAAAAAAAAAAVVAAAAAAAAIVRPAARSGHDLRPDFFAGKEEQPSEKLHAVGWVAFPDTVKLAQRNAHHPQSALELGCRVLDGVHRYTRGVSAVHCVQFANAL